jgi:hypothetical protein
MRRKIGEIGKIGAVDQHGRDIVRPLAVRSRRMAAARTARRSLLDLLRMRWIGSAT